MATKKGSSKGSAAAKKGGGSKGSSKGTTKAAAGKGSSKKSGGKTSAKASAKGSGKKGGLKAAAGTAWTGTPTTINRNENLQMSQTPNGMLIFSYFNQSTTQNTGTLIVSSGGASQPPLKVPGLQNQPLLLVNNWQGSNLSVSNVSTTTTPILIEAVGPGLPGLTPVALPMDGTILPLAPYGAKTGFAAAQGNAPAQNAMVSLQSNTSKLTILAIQVENTVWVVALNAAQEAGPGTQNPNTAPPAGYYATTTTNNYQNVWNWGSAAVFVVNMSPFTSAGGTISVLPV
ncbi:MAG: hypothetical protein ACJ74T_19595 [Pyrinomonadaceae bacterium]